jgi:hypothetical protein
MEETRIQWSEYMLYRMNERGYEASKLEDIIRHSAEQYTDTETGRTVIVGRHDELLVLIPIDVEESTVTPVTVHATTRQQINLRLQTGRFRV